MADADRPAAMARTGPPNAGEASQSQVLCTKSQSPLTSSKATESSHGKKSGLFGTCSDLLLFCFTYMCRSYLQWASNASAFPFSTAGP